MRNLKKILALVLALVMSLSLMATASAADFKDASSINDTYETAVEVLSGLGVFNGYKEDGTFRPQGSITRAETAAIIYRIVTGDVDDKQVGIYADYNIFTDVPSTAWYAGYVNFCANAEYIKGVGNGKFNPQGQVTGYAALAMILRAIGYTANGGFTGPDWEVQTARTAEARKITKNIMTSTLGQPATRETVAEILFQSILVNMVDHNVLNTLNGDQGYFEKDITLGYKTFKLEELEGVIVANEFADLYSTSVLANGKTNFEVAKDDVRSLNISTAITDIGMRQLAYIAESKVLSMTDKDLNKVTETGAATNISTPAQFRSTADMNQVDDTQFYVNFGRNGNYSCDQRLEFQVTFYNPIALASFIAYAGVNPAAVAADDNRDNADTAVSNRLDNDWTVTLNWGNTAAPLPSAAALPAAGPYTFTAADYPVRFHKIIRADMDISENDLLVIYGIFGAADNAIAGVTNNPLARDRIDGDVFVGTYSTTVTQNDRDISNAISYAKFFETYINPVTYDVNWNTSGNGDWVKFIDNDLDGNADYAFKTVSWLDEATGTYTNKAGDTITEYYAFDEENSTVRYMDGNTPAVGDVVVCALIDGQILVEPAKSVTETVNNYNWREDAITTTDGNTYGQSAIGNATEMQQLIRNMEDKTEYIMYFDHFGYVRAYKLPGNIQYALITEIYAKNAQDGNVLQNWPMTVELKVAEADPHEYSLAGGGANIFVGATAWTEVWSVVGTQRYYNWLQPAIAHLGVTRIHDVLGANQYLGATKGNPTFVAGDNWALWPAWNQYVKVVTPADAAGLEEFNYGRYDRTIPVVGQETGNTYSFTNVALANINGETATLTAAAQLRLNANGNVMAWNDQNGNGLYDGAPEVPRYAVDYVKLTTADVAAQQVNYPIAADYPGWQNRVVNATHNTEFYIVHNDGVYYVKDYVNMPKLTAADNYIYAAYAVARDTSADSATQPYWVADVIVYEVRTWNDDLATSTALVYFNQMRTTGDVQLLKTLSTVSGGPMVDVVPTNLNWNAQAGSFRDYSGYGFYKVWNGTAVEDGQMGARRVTRIPATGETYGQYGIYAGTVDRVTEDAVNGGYIYVTTQSGGSTMRIALAVNNNVYEIQNDNQLGGGNYNEASTLRYNNLSTNEVVPGDRIIWIGGARNTKTVCSASFIVDLGTPVTGVVDTISEARFVATPGFLTATEWNAINLEQGTAAAAGDNVEVTIKYVIKNGQSADDQLAFAKLGKGDYTFEVSKKTGLVLKADTAQLVINGWTLDSLTCTGVDTEASVGTLTDSNTTLTVASADLTQDLEVVAAYTKTAMDIDVAFNLTATNGSAITVNYNIPTATTKTGSFTSAAAATVGTGMDWAGKATLTWTGAEHTVYSLSGTDAGKFTISNVGNKWTVTAKDDGVRGQYDITIEDANEPTIGLTLQAVSANATVTKVSPADVYPGSVVTVTAVPDAGYQVLAVRWTEAGSAVWHDMERTSNANEWTFKSGDKVGTAAVTIRATVVPENVQVDLAAGADTAQIVFSAAGENFAGTAVSINSGANGNVAYNSAVTVTAAGGNIWVLASDGAGNSVTCVGTIANNGTPVVTVPNVTGAVTLTVYGSQTAYDTALAALA